MPQPIRKTATTLVLTGVLWALVGVVFTPGCRQAPPRPQADDEPVWFQDITAEAGLHFVHDPGPVGDYFFPQIVGSGAALFDFDGDGRLDIYLIHNGGPTGARNQLFRQGLDGRFTDVSAGSGLAVAGWGMGAAAGDVNNDGRPDLLVTEYGRSRLFLNLGAGKFQDVSREAGLDNPHWGVSAAWFDYDRDGWLDLIVVNYVDYAPGRPCADSTGTRDYCGPKSFPGQVARLYRNLGPKNSGSEDRGESGEPPFSLHVPRFEDVTYRAGLGRFPGPGLGVLCLDFTGDRWPDILVANDAAANWLWVNQRDGTFKEEGVVRGLAYNALGQAEANMGIAVGDVDGDGLFDVFITHLTDETNRLWRQGPLGLFQDQTAAVGLTAPRWRGTGFGTVLHDFDHDGWPDLAVVNGRVKRMDLFGTDAAVANSLDAFWGPYAERDQLFANTGQGRFRDISLVNPPFCGTAWVSRGLACGDLDNDGDLDLLVTTIAGPALLYRNVAPKRGHWLTVRAVDPALRRDAYGAEVTVTAEGRHWHGWINPGYSYLCSNDPRAHFGLGEAGQIEAIRVAWPDGSVEVFPGCPADRQVVLRRGEGITPPIAAVSDHEPKGVLARQGLREPSCHRRARHSLGE